MPEAYLRLPCQLGGYGQGTLVRFRHCGNFRRIGFMKEQFHLDATEEGFSASSLCLHVVPETKERTLEEIERSWASTAFSGHPAGVALGRV